MQVSIHWPTVDFESSEFQHSNPNIWKEYSEEYSGKAFPIIQKSVYPVNPWLAIIWSLYKVRDRRSIIFTWEHVVSESKKNTAFSNT